MDIRLQPEDDDDRREADAADTRRGSHGREDDDADDDDSANLDAKRNNLSSTGNEDNDNDGDDEHEDYDDDIIAETMTGKRINGCCACGTTGR